MKHTISLIITIVITLIALFVPQRFLNRMNFSPIKFKEKETVHRVIVIVLFIIGFSVRFYQFGSLPDGISIDEAIIGYDSFSILHYGIDHNGISYPVHLTSFGSGQHALYAYLSIPWISIFGLNQFSIRIVNLIFGLLSLVIFYFLVYKTDNSTTALVALFIIAINPWHIMISRWGLECNLLPAMFLLGTYFLVRFLQTGKNFWAATFFYGLSLYAYGTAYFVVPFFLLTIFIYLLITKHIRLSKLVIGLVLLALIATPIVLYVTINSLGEDSLKIGMITIPKLTGSARFSQVISIFSGNFLKRFWHNIVALGELLVTQDDGYIWNAIPGYGTLYLFSLPLIISGIWAFCKENSTKLKLRLNFVFFFWLVTAVFAAILMRININRINIIYLPLLYFIARGIIFIGKRWFLLAGMVILLYIAWFGLFTYTYFKTYPPLVASAFNQSLGDAIQDASSRTDGVIYISNELHLPYAYVLFYEQPSPYEFINSAVYPNPEENFREVTSFDRYRFINPTEMNDKIGVYVVQNRETGYFRSDKYSINKYQFFSVIIPNGE